LRKSLDAVVGWKRAAAWPLLAVLAVSLTVAGSVLVACNRDSRAPAPRSSGSQAQEGYPVRGTVVSSDPATGELKLQHGAVPGLMGAMTMSYRLQDPSALSEVHPGDVITATIVSGAGSEGQDMQLKDIDVIAQAKPDYVPAVQYHVPAAGDPVPDFRLLNQSDRSIDLKQFRGKVVVMTFIYTRCPLSDYCVRMSHNFAEIDKALQADPKLFADTHLLSVSFDPAYDTPRVLKSYGEAYTGRYVKETFEHWDFAAPPAAELPKVEQYFDVGVTPAKNGTLQHSLSTVVLGKDGKVVAFWPTNDWTVADVMSKIRAAAAALA
jgi:protein SCO1/2